MFDVFPLSPLANQIALSLLLAAPLAITRSARAPKNARLRFRPFLTMGLTVAIGAIWLAEIQSLLLSLTAVAMALVLATKELIACATGSLLRVAGRSYEVGDQIAVDGVSGRVVAHSLLTTTIRETDCRALGSRFTGRTLVMPNSRLFGGGVEIEDRDATAKRHAFSLTLETALPVRVLIEGADAIAGSYAIQGEPEPRVSLVTNEFGKIRLDIVVFCCKGETFETQRRLSVELLDWIAEQGRGARTRASTMTLIDREAA